MSIQQANKKQVRIFTDGSCDTGSREGGWGYLLICGAARKTASGYEANTTNNRMELSAAVKALEALREPCEVTLVTDSQYLKKSLYRRVAAQLAAQWLAHREQATR